tara:strand:- start:124 stop:519 length:396 start_codon:yes stop_codon:yes gene_type:complete
MITIQPSNPTSDTSVAFVFTGGSPCPVPSQTIDGSEFIFEVQDDDQGPCLGTPIPYEFTWNAGTLDAGAYQVTHIDPRMPTETLSFIVVEGTQPSSETIPAMGLGSTIILAALISVVAARVLQRNRRRTSH